VMHPIHQRAPERRHRTTPEAKRGKSLPQPWQIGALSMPNRALAGAF
jgi:hypothetical protein